jgi:hypothetical protein
MLFLMINAIADFADSIAPDLWERYFNAVVDGLCRQTDCGPDVAARRPPLKTDEVLSAMASWRPASVR